MLAWVWSLKCTVSKKLIILYHSNIILHCYRIEFSQHTNKRMSNPCVSRPTHNHIQVSAWRMLCLTSYCFVQPMGHDVVFSWLFRPSEQRNIILHTYLLACCGFNSWVYHIVKNNGTHTLRLISLTHKRLKRCPLPTRTAASSEVMIVPNSTIKM